MDFGFLCNALGLFFLAPSYLQLKQLYKSTLSFDKNILNMRKSLCIVGLFFTVMRIVPSFLDKPDAQTLPFCHGNNNGDVYYVV